MIAACGSAERVAMIDPDAFKTAMGSFPCGVVIATTLDPQGQPWGFTASSFASVSLEPPLVLVCLARSAECHARFAVAQRFSISILAARDEALARRFATRGAPKFAGDEFVLDAHGLPLIRNAVAALTCRKFSEYGCGDHSVIIGEVQAVDLGGEGEAAVYYRQRFWRFPPALDESLRPGNPAAAFGRDDQ
jgi:flavin reductase ActVB